MELELKSICFLLAAALLGGYAFVFGLLKKLHEWYHVAKVGMTKYPLPPGDMGWPVLGNIPTFIRKFKSDPDSFIFDLVARYGKTGMYKTHLFGSPSIIVCTPETCRRVFTDDEQFKLGYPESAKILTGRKAFHSISNAEHKRLRKLTTSPINGHEALSMYIDLIEHIAIDSLEQLASMKEPVELLKELRHFAFKVITNIFVGSDADAVNLGFLEHCYTDLNQGLKSRVINFPGFPFYKAMKARKKLVKLLQALLDGKRTPRTRKGERDVKKGMMDLLMEIKDEDGTPLDDEYIVDLLLLFFLAGHESSAHGVLWSVIFLTANPEVFKKAKEEQEEVIKRRPSTQKGLTLSEIRQMHYLSMVIDEMLRRTSISFSNFREAKMDVIMNGYKIPKGWKVLIWNRAVHMDPEVYTNPQEFNPSRWENRIVRPGTYLPFGLGSRLCPGSDLAKLETAIFLHHFLLNYRMERINPDCPLKYLPCPHPADNCLARIIKVE
uniref:Cytochrome P450 CYP88A85 n=1 Tax=Polygala tenuifolia TaxID=355332 RepID=A0A1Z2WUZ0_9FABA|nr:cytochrome P450 CYP88A85 [Polygala tenuifolia]